MKRIVLIAVAVFLLLPGAVLAQQPESEAKRPPDDYYDQPGAPMEEAAPAIRPDPDELPAAGGERRMAPSGPGFLQQCEDLLRTDAAWRTRLRDQLTQRLLADEAEAASELNQENLDWRARMKRELAVEIHQQDADAMATNRKHVIMAYAALWVLTALFIVYMYMRQVRLREEITRLEREIRDAAKS